MLQTDVLPQGLQHGPERKVRLELVSVLDVFGSFSIKGKGTRIPQ